MNIETRGAIKVVFLFIFGFCFGHCAFATPNLMTFQSRIIKPDGKALEESSVNFRFSITDALGTCVIYQEDFVNRNMSGTKGLINLNLGGGTKVYPVSAINLNEVFNNYNFPTFNCQAGGTVNAGATDRRRLVMQFNDGSGWQTVPAMDINSNPYAMQAAKAYSLGDYPAADYLRTASLPTCNPATHALTFNGSNFTCAAVSGGGGSVTQVTSANADIGVATTTTTPVLTLNSSVTGAADKIVKLDSSGNFGAINASALTNLNATQLASGTVPAARMPALTGDVTMTAGTTATTISNNAVTDAKVDAAAAIARSKLANGANNSIVVNNGSGVMTDVFCADGQIVKWAAGSPVCATDAIGSGGDVNNGGNSFSGTMTIGTNDNNHLNFETNGTNKMTILANGNVGIGTTNPSQALTISGTLMGLGTGFVQMNTNEVLVGNSNGIGTGGGVSMGIGNYSSYTSVAIGRSNGTSAGAGSAAMGIANNANWDNSVALGIGNTTGAMGAVAIGRNISNSISGSLQIGASDSSKLTILSSGNVGIGTTSPSGILQVYEGVSASVARSPLNVQGGTNAVGLGSGNPAGDIILYAPNGGGTNFNHGGNVLIKAGYGGGTGGSSVEIRAGPFQSALFTTPASLTLGRSTSVVSGSVNLHSGYTDAYSASSGSLSLFTTNANSSYGAGGNIAITAGNGSTGASGYNTDFGGAISITAGNGGVQHNLAGSNVVINPGAGGGSGAHGNVILSNLRGRVGIGTTSPQRLLHVAGPLRLTPSALPGTPAAGDIAVDNADANKLKWHDGTSWQTIGTGGGGVTNVSSANADITIANGSTTPEMTLNSSVVGAADKIVKLDASGNFGAINASALTNLNAGALASGTVPAARMPALTGDVTTSSGAVATTIAANAVTSAKIADDEILDADIKTTAAIARSKLASGTADHVLINNGSGVMASEPQLAVSRGGTGLGSYTSNALLMANVTGTGLTNATCATGEILMWNVTTWSCTSMASSTMGYFKDGGNTFTGTATLGTNSNHNLEIETNGTTKMTVLANGDIGIGTSAPNYKLDVLGGFFRAGFNSGGSLPASDNTNGGLIVGWNRISGGGQAEVNLYNAYEFGPAAGPAFLFSQKTGASTVVDLLSINRNGNIGIGTTNPSSALHVLGANGTSGNAPNALTVVGGTGGTNSNGGSISLTAGYGNGSGVGGDVSIAAGAGGATNVNGSNVVINGGAKGGSGSDGNVILANTRGNVGIGTTSPASILTTRVRAAGDTGLEVQNPAGSKLATIKDDGYGFGDLKVYDNLNNARFSVNGFSAAGPTIGIDGASGNTVDGFTGWGGIAAFITVPAVVGNENGILFGSGGGQGAAITHYVSGLLSAGEGGLKLKTNNGGGMLTRMTIDENGSVGIGTTSPQAIFDITSTGPSSALIVPRATTGNRPTTPVDGMVRYNSTTSLFEFYQNGSWVNYTTVSDGRLKTNVVPIQNGLEIVNQLNPVFFDWDQNNPRAQSFGTQHQVGFIAQDVEKTLPEVVHVGQDSYRSVEYGKIVSVVVAAVKELYLRLVNVNEKLENHDREIATVKAENLQIKQKAYFDQLAHDSEVQKLRKENSEMKARLDKIEKLMNSR